MKKLFLLGCTLSILSLSQVKAEPYQIGSSSLYLKSIVGSGYFPFAFGYDYGLTDKISAGAFVSYGAYSPSGIATSYLSFGVKGDYHFYNQDKWDIFAGVHLGLIRTSTTTPSSTVGGITIPSVSATTSGFGAGAKATARYYLTDNFAVAAGLGYSNVLGYFDIGIVWTL